MGTASQMSHCDLLLDLNNRQHRPRLPCRDFAARTEMLESPADIGLRRYWIDFHSLGVCYPLLEAEIFGTVMCVTASLRMLSARGFNKDCGQGTSDADLHGTIGSIAEWAVICFN